MGRQVGEFLLFAVKQQLAQGIFGRQRSDASVDVAQKLQLLQQYFAGDGKLAEAAVGLGNHRMQPAL